MVFKSTLTANNAFLLSLAFADSLGDQLLLCDDVILRDLLLVGLLKPNWTLCSVSNPSDFIGVLII